MTYTNKTTRRKRYLPPWISFDNKEESSWCLPLYYPPIDPLHFQVDLPPYRPPPIVMHRPGDLRCFSDGIPLPRETIRSLRIFGGVTQDDRSQLRVPWVVLAAPSGPERRRLRPFRLPFFYSKCRTWLNEWKGGKNERGKSVLTRVPSPVRHIKNFLRA